MRITRWAPVALLLACPVRAQAPPFSSPTDYGVFALVGDSASVLSTSLQNSSVDGISLRQSWSEVEPTDGVYDFTYLDSQVKAARSAGKLVAIAIKAGVGTPAWLFNEGARGFNTVDPSGCQNVVVPVPWDPVFLSKWTTFIQKVGAHYAGTPIGRIQLTGFNLGTEETLLPANTGQVVQGCTTNNDVQEWQDLGYTGALVKSAWTRITATFAGAFPGSRVVPSLVPGGFPPIDDVGRPNPAWVNLENQLIELTSGQPQLGLQNNALSDYFIDPLVISYATSKNTGHQMLWFVTSDSTCRMNHRNTPCDPHTELLQAVSVGLEAEADYLEIYQTDIANPALADIVSLAHQRLHGDSFEFTAPTYSVVEGTPVATITVQRTRGAALTETVDYKTSEGTASTSRYTPVSGSLTFGPGVTTRTFTVPIVNDTAYEGAQTVMLSLSSPSPGAVLGPQNTAVLTIVDNDVPGSVQFSVGAFSCTEGGTATISVVRTGGAASGVSVAYKTSDGTATAPTNYTSSSGVLVFGAGQTVQTFTVKTIPSGVQGNLTVGLTLSSPQGGASLGGVAAAVLTIVATNPVYQFSASGYSVTQAGPSVLITVTRTGSVTGTGSVSYATSDGTAHQGVNYTPVSGSLVFAPGVGSRTFSVPIIPTTTFQGTLTVVLTLSNPSSGGVVGALNPAVLSIKDLYPAGSLSLGAPNYSVSAAGKTLTVTVVRASGNASGVSVRFGATDGTALLGRDYLLPSGSPLLTFGLGVVSQSFVVTILNDPNPHADRTFTISLHSPGGGATLGSQNSAPVTILTTSPVVAFTAAGYSVAEKGKLASITVSRSRNLAGTVTVQCSTSDGTATAPADYTPVSQTLTFAPGVASGTCQVPIADDSSVEGNETINLTLSNPGGGAQLGALTQAVLTIGTDDPSVQFAASGYLVAETSPNALISVSRTGSTTQAVSVHYSTLAGGTATLGQNYLAASGTLAFAPGQTLATFEVPILQDLRVGANKTVLLGLSSVSGGLIGPLGAGTLTITQADLGGTIQFSTPSFSAAEAAGGLATITVTRSGGTGQVTVFFATSDGTAAAGTDYAATSGSLLLSPDQPQGTVYIPILADGVNGSPAKTVHLTLSLLGPGATLGTPSTATLWLVQD
jgi:hypothetical protein